MCSVRKIAVIRHQICYSLRKKIETENLKMYNELVLDNLAKEFYFDITKTPKRARKGVEHNAAFCRLMFSNHPTTRFSVRHLILSRPCQ